MKKYIFSIACIAILLTSCGGNEFKVSGTIDGATDTTRLVLESSNNGRWLIVDSVKPSGSGDFKVAEKAPQFADIYRLRYGDKAIYFPIDSIDDIHIKGNLKAFDTDYTLSGSDNAVAVMNIDRKARSIAPLQGASYDAAVAAWKRDLANQILRDPSGIVAYYIINKYINDRPLYDAGDKDDLKIIGAVANAFNTFKPNDPRTAFLVNTLLTNKRAASAASAKMDTMYVSETPIIDIKLQDKNGKMQSLASITGKGKVVILNFMVYSADFSPVFNKVLADVYRKHQASGFEIFQIGYDDDEFQWRQSAKNLPWITVYDPEGVQSRNLSAYNVTQIPTVFIINRKGEIVERVQDITKLDASVSKYM
jgi:peroxiredoxin